MSIGYGSSAEIPPRVARLMSEEDRKRLKVKLPEEIHAEQEVEAERDLQNLCESWLRQQGYWPRTLAFLTGGKPERGWYAHVYNARRNPLFLDILLFANDGRFLEIELKTATGPLRAHQLIIIERHRGKLARSFDQFVDIVMREGFLG